MSDHDIERLIDAYTAPAPLDDAPADPESTADSASASVGAQDGQAASPVTGGAPDSSGKLSGDGQEPHPHLSE